MIVTSTFVGQVMKFEDLKELGSESAVKVCVPLHRALVPLFRVSTLRSSNVSYCRLLENTNRRGKPTWCRMGTLSTSNSMCLAVGRSEKKMSEDEHIQQCITSYPEFQHF